MRPVTTMQRKLDGGSDSARWSSFANHTPISSWDDVAIGAIGIVVGAIPVVAAVVRGGPWGTEPTIGLAMCVLSGGVLLECALGRRRGLVLVGSRSRSGSR